MMKKLLYFIFFTIHFTTINAQTINITTVTATGRFNSCGFGDPTVTASLINSTGTTVAGNTLICNDPCGTTTLRVVLSGVRWNQGSDLNWVHGLFFPQNPGFSISGISLPAGWASFASCTGAACSSGQVGGQGFYFDGATGADCCTNSDQDGIPNNNYGDEFVDCNLPLAFQFDMTFCNSAISGSSLNFQLSGTADGNTGCYNVPDGNRDNRINFSIGTSSCPDIYNVPFTSNIITDCSVSPANFYAQITGGCGNGNTVTWWDAPFGGNQIGSGVSFIYDPAGNACPAGTIIYASCCPVGATDCANREAVTITGNCPAAPGAAFTQVNPNCSNINNGTISITPNTGGPYNVTLTGPGGPYNITGPAPVVFGGLAPGTYNFSFSDAGGCVGNGGPITLTTNTPLYTPAILVNPLCNAGSNGRVSFNPIGGVAGYEYSSDAGTNYQAGNSFTGLTAGTHNFRIRDNVGCFKDTTITLTEPSIVSTVINTTSAAGCSNNDGTLTASGNGGTAPYTYIITGPTVNTTGVSTGIFSGLSNGSYTITLTDAGGCTATSLSATVGLVDNMFLSLGGDVTICAENSVTFNPQTNDETNIFTWTGINGTLISTIANASIKNAVATPLDTATYALHAQWGGCERRDTIVVNVLRKPVANAGLDTAICNQTYVILRGSANNTSGNVNYEWSNGNVEFPDQAVTRAFPPGSNTVFSYTLTVRDEYGCNFSVTDQVDITIQPPVPAFAGNDTTAVQATPHQLFASGGNNYLWTPAAPLNSATAQNPLATLQADQKFVVRVTDFAGCVGYDTVFIKVYEGPAYYIPNAFTPNGDGINDVFRPVPAGIARTSFFRIFNRYGEAIFETNQYMKGWDGTYKGKKQPVGVYIWVIKGIDRDGKNVEMKGTVMLAQ